ncbi:ubiquitin-like small modifier protein SAMP2 [Halovenus marina]|uniref:ubiquitin-like small modifier protein SAMP2 n=1 Tax=Halovenus marina TaxID=3396621 RepID=UPI003F57F312
MSVTVEVVNEGIEEVETDDGATFGDLLDPFDVSEQEIIVLVDGLPAALDAEMPDDVDQVRVVPATPGG